MKKKKYYLHNKYLHLTIFKSASRMSNCHGCGSYIHHQMIHSYIQNSHAALL